MVFIDEDLFNKLITDKRSKATVIKYDYNIKHIFKKLNIDKFDRNILKSHKDEIIKLINEITTITARDISFGFYYLSKLYLDDLIINDYKLNSYKIFDKFKNDYKPPKEKRLERNLSIYKLKNIRDDIISRFENLKSYKNALYCRIACLQCFKPLRSQDYYNTIITNEDLKDINHLNLTSKKIIIYYGKTQTRKEGFRFIQIDDEICLKYLHETEKILNSKWLIPTLTNNNLNLNESSYYKIMMDIFKCSSNDFRQIFISHLQDINAHPKEKFKLSIEMGHHYITAMKHYTQFADSIHNEDFNKKLNDLIFENEKLKIENEFLKSMIDESTETETIKSEISDISNFTISSDIDSEVELEFYKEVLL
jgi:hypothetical protein